MTNTELQQEIYNKAFERLVDARSLLMAAEELYSLQGVYTSPFNLAKEITKICEQVEVLRMEEQSHE